MSQNTKMEATPQDLETAEAISEQQMLRPSPAEIASIKEYCNITLQKRELEMEAKKETQTFREAAKAAKEKLFNIMKTNPENTITFSKDKLREMDVECAKEGFQSVPPFLRWLSINKDSPIKPEVIEEAIQSISAEDIDEMKAYNKENNIDASIREVLREILLQKIRQLIRSISQNVKLSPSLERGKKQHEVPECDDLAETVLQWHLNENRIKKKRDQCKESVTLFGGQIKDLQDPVEKFFDRTQTTSQKIVLNDRTFRLVKKTSVRKPRVGMTAVVPWINEAFDNLKIDNVRTFHKNSNQVLKYIQEKMDEVKGEEKSSVSLVAVKSTDTTN